MSKNKFLAVGKTFSWKDIKTGKDKSFVVAENKDNLPNCKGCWFSARQHCPDYDCGADAREDKKFVIFKEKK